MIFVTGPIWPHDIRFREVNNPVKAVRNGLYFK